MQPGQTITPGEQPPAPQPPQGDGSHDQQQTGPVQVANLPPQEVPTPADSPQETGGWSYTEESETNGTSPAPHAQPVTWTASEYVAHSKGPAWFVALGLGLFAVMALVYLLTRDILSSVLVGVAGVTFGAFAARQPRVLQYGIDATGVHIGGRTFPYQELKSFTVQHDGPLPAIVLFPLKRFLPPITVFYDPQGEDEILLALGNYLPLENKQPDAVDRLMKRIRF